MKTTECFNGESIEFGDLILEVTYNGRSGGFYFDGVLPALVVKHPVPSAKNCCRLLKSMTGKMTDVTFIPGERIELLRRGAKYSFIVQ